VYNYPWIKEIVETGKLYKNMNGRFYFRLAHQGIPEVFKPRDITIKEAVERA
jgi:hypothetical protein